MKTFVHFCKVCLSLETPHSQVTMQELDLLLRYSTEARIIVELGCFEGKTGVALAKTCPQAAVYSIDPFLVGRLKVPYGELISRFYRRKEGAQNLHFMKGYSFDFAPKFSQAIDLLFIDADHSYDAVRRDWHDWFPKVRTGGVVALHDSQLAANSPSKIGSMRFYSEELTKVERIKQIDAVDSLVAFRVTW